MNCSQVKQNIPPWLDGELAAGEAAVIASHIADCPDCGHEAAFWQEVNAALKADFCAVTAPPELAGKVMAQLNGRQRNVLSSVLSGWKRNLAVAAAFLLIAVGSVSAYLYSGGGDHVAIDPNVKPNVHVVTPNVGPDVDPNVGPNADSQHDPANNAAQKDNEPGVTPAQPGPENKPDNKPDGVTNNNDNGPKVNVNTNQPDQQAPVQPNQGPQPDQGVNSQPIEPAQPNAASALALGAETGDEYAFLSVRQDRFAENTLIRVKVANMDTAYKQAMVFINSCGAQSEVLDSEIIPSSSQETLKITVDSSRSENLKKAFINNLGTVITTSTQKDDLNSRYNEKVERYRSLQEKLQT
ncbi:MAG: zf-HC2 domain-containing protein, partial [Firmicutes bacterium]|nr:zf-HC2 domain-containing protein [Bacillota bacterium]